MNSPREPARAAERGDPHASLAGRSVLVMGLGAFGGGAGAARYLAERGARVRATDQRAAHELGPALEQLAGLPVEFTLGEHRRADFERAELVIANPAVAPSDPLLARARAAGARISSEIELFLEACPARVAAITGTQGKSSTTSMCAQLLRHCGFETHLGGNIGGSLLASLPAMRAEHAVALELSSYQLEALAQPEQLAARVEAVCIVNVLPDHLERHGSLAAYAAAKRRILDLLAPGGTAVLPAVDAHASAWQPPRGRSLRCWPHPPPAAERAHALWIEDGRFRSASADFGAAEDLRLPGAFQRDNALAALGLAHALGCAPERLARALPQLRGLPYRLEDLGLHAGHRVIDNGVSTTPDSTISALRALAEPCALLCGGKAKDLPLDELVQLARERVRIALCFGEAAPQFAERFAAAGVEAHACRELRSAVALAFERMRAGETLLFSPAAASFDAYRNFEQRVRDFRAALAHESARRGAPSGAASARRAD